MKIRIAGMRENRKFVRIDHSLPIRFQVLDESGRELLGETIHAQTRDLCSSGACIMLDELDEKFWRDVEPDKSFLKLELDLPGSESPLTVKGRVQWLSRGGEGGYLFGAEFSEMDEAGRARLVEFLKDRFIDKARKEDFAWFEAHTALEVENLTKKDWRGRTLLDSISFSVPQGRTVAIVGPNESCKTLLIHILAAKVGFDEGNGRILGFNLATQARIIRKIIGFMPQRLALYSNLTGLENVHFFARGLGVPESQLKDRAAQTLSFCELSDAAAMQVRKMDMDQTRRLSLAVALVHNPKILILDEPFTGADPKLRYNFKSTFRRLTQAGVTILFTAHRLDNATGCDRIALLHQGRIIAFEDPVKLMARFPSRVTIGFGGEEESLEVKAPEEQLPALLEQFRAQGKWPPDKILVEPPDPEDVWLNLVRDEDDEL